MEEIKNLFEALKEFIWDVIGYFLPGMYAIILVSVIVNPEYFIKTPLLSEKDEGINFITVILAYILGYVIYGISEAKENVRGKKSYTGKIEEAISKTKNYELASQLLQKKIDASAVAVKVSDLEMKEVRNIAMSYAPESDKKVYTFMFRCELSRHIANTSFLIGGMSLLLVIIHMISGKLNIINYDGVHIVLYIFLVAIFYALNVTRDRFYRIAMSIPFSIFISTNK